MTIGRGGISRRAALKALLATGVGAATGGSAYGFLYERHALELTQAAVPVVGLPPALAGLRIGLITDIHRSRWVSAEDVARRGRCADGGQAGPDRPRRRLRHLGRPRLRRPAAEALRGLSAPHGVFGILGNHDDDHDMPAALAANGVEMLKDARTR